MSIIVLDRLVDVEQRIDALVNDLLGEQTILGDFSHELGV